MTSHLQFQIRLLQRIEKKVAWREGRSRHLTGWRLVSFGLGLLLAVIAIFKSGRSFWWWGLSGISWAGFVILVIEHERLKTRLFRLRLWQRIKEENIARYKLDWSKIPCRVYPEPSSHPYAFDFDILGEYSLLRLLNTTISLGGRNTLMNWLLYPEPDQENLRRRQQLVQELKNRNLFRDKLILEAWSISEKEIQGEKLLSLLEHPLWPFIPWLFKAESLLLGVSAIGFLGWFWLGWPGQSFTFPYLAYILGFLFSLPYLASVFHRSLSLQLEFKKLEALFIHLENRTSVKTPQLLKYSSLFHGQKKPSSSLAKLTRICDCLSIQGNWLIHLGVNMFLPWDFFFAGQWERQRQEIRYLCPLWLEQLGLVEAGCALAGLADHHANFIIPQVEVDEKKSCPGIRAVGLGHPLIPSEQRKTNDFYLEGQGTIGLITGSNMSGKSTFLKTVGINLCLAQAGGYVCASSFRSSWFRLYGCLRIHDSLTEGLSYFYAEVKRLKMILDASLDDHLPPVFMLIDEILKGTNNRERNLGSTSYLRALVQNNLLGLVSTHDFEVTRISQDEEKIVNFHFQEEIEHNRMKFDYLLRPGVCPTTNALKILHLEGLPVPESQ